MSITSGLTPLISYLNTTDEGKPKELKDYDQNFKDYIFDYEDPYEYATLPLYAAGPAGIIANRTIKVKKIADKAYKPSGIESILSKPGVNVGIPAATLAGDVTYDLATDEEFVGDIKTIAGIEDDALDQANEDLKKVNEKEEQKVADAEDMDDPSEEEEEKGLAGLQDQLAVFQNMMAPGEMTGGYIMEGTGIATPEIRRYEAGGIASLEPEMMAAGGVPGFKKGIAVLIKEAAKKAKDAVKPKKKDKVEAEKKKSDTKTETKTEKAKRILPPEIATAIGVPIGASLKLSKEALKKAGGEGGMGRGAARTGIYGGLGLAAYNALTGDDDTSSKAADVKLPPPPEPEESDALKDILYQNSLERATAAGRTEPSFIDYLSSFPGSYTEKVGKDPEFAKQMMAGFMAMMKPTEGFVPRNALVDFGEAAYAEQARQQDAVPDQLQLIKEFAENPELAKAYRDFQRSAEPVDLVTEQQNRELLFRNLQTMIFGEKFDEDDDIPVDIRTGQPADSFSVYNEFIALGGDTAALTKIKENYAQP